MVTRVVKRISKKLVRLLQIPDTETLIIGYWLTWIVIPVIVIFIALFIVLEC